ncbi:MAG: TIM barrel protein [Candidatus Latescibacteria bacterium]|nr:TIM barrel protein [Candidatus Latescibacterota bacterium]
MNAPPFKLALYLPELRLPFEKAVAAAADIGVDFLWHSFGEGPCSTKHLLDMSDAEVDATQACLDAHRLKFFLINAGAHFKQLHLTDLQLDTLQDHPEFRRDFKALERAMEVAAHLGVAAVNPFTFAWPGEYSAGKPTWPMRWLTRGGYIAPVDMDKLVKAFSLVAEAAERHQVDVALSMMCWNYTNTTAHFRRLAEAVGSPRLKVMWGPADNTNCGESDVASAGFLNVRPYLYGLHLKDLRVNDGLALDFDYCPIGEGDVDYPTVLNNLRRHQCDVFLSLATHFLPPSGDPVEAMRINYANLQGLLNSLETP